MKKFILAIMVAMSFAVMGSVAMADESGELIHVEVFNLDKWSDDEIFAKVTEFTESGWVIEGYTVTSRNTGMVVTFSKPYAIVNMPENFEEFETE